MIKLVRAFEPEILSEPWVERAYAEAGRFFAEQDSSARRVSYRFDSKPLRSEELISALVATSNGRCSFCGLGDIHATGSADVHRLRPRQEAVAADGRTSREHYWWLAYEWENLYLACAACNRAKGSKFPTEKRRVPVETRFELNERERPLIIDPVWEDPEPHFVYLDTGEVSWFDERGLITIETFDLNRPGLVEERRKSILMTKLEIGQAGLLLASDAREEFVAAFLHLFSTEAPLAAVRRQFSNQWAQVRPQKIERCLAEATSGEVTLGEVAGSLRRVTGRVKASMSRRLNPVFAEPGEHLVSAPVPEIQVDTSAYEMSRTIRAIEIQNFQGIDSMHLNVGEGAGRGSWLMLLGENGAGKTATLKAVALTLMTDKERERILPDPAQVLRKGESSGHVRVDLTGARNVREFHFGRGAEDNRLAGSHAPLLLAAYGATRLLPGDRVKGADGRGPRTGSLFDPRFPLTRPADWLPDLNRDQFDAVASGLQRILRLDDAEEIHRDKRRGFTIAYSGGRLHLADLSDGYRTMAILALDMMNMFLDTWGRLDQAEGIVLIDEIGAHLHPRWQMKVVGAMRETFPRVQFIATTHDPLCLRGLEDGEVVVLRSLGRKLIAQQAGLPPVKGLTVDQLLTSEHFGLFSTLDPETEGEFERYYELLAAPELDKAEQEELEIHQMALAGRQQLGRTRRERLALEGVDRYLANERFATSAEDLRQLPEAAREGVRHILEEVD